MWGLPPPEFPPFTPKVLLPPDSKKLDRLIEVSKKVNKTFKKLPRETVKAYKPHYEILQRLIKEETKRVYGDATTRGPQGSTAS